MWGQQRLPWSWTHRHEKTMEGFSMYATKCKTVGKVQ